MKLTGLPVSILYILLIIGMASHSKSANSASFSDTSSGGDWRTLRQGFRLIDHYYDAAVSNEIRYFSQHYFNRLRKRIMAYQAYLNMEVCDRKIPAELALLPLIESALNAEARSPASAVGFWQFMPETAKEYGLTVNDPNDGRKDLVLATDAALNLLEKLYEETGDWLLTIAAYNVGGPRLRKAVARNPRQSFWELRLPVETRRHVAKLLALSRVILSPEQHGLILPDLKPTQLSRFDAFLSEEQPEKLAEDFGRAKDITTVSRINPLDIQRQLLRPPH